MSDLSVLMVFLIVCGVVLPLIPAPKKKADVGASARNATPNPAERNEVNA